MTILFICSEYPPFALQGGIGTMTKTLAEALVKLGHTIFVAGVYNSISKDTVKVESGVTCILLKKNKLIKRDWIDRIRLFKQISRLVKEHSIDLIEAPDYMGLTAFWPNIKTPVILRLHGSVTFLSIEQSLAVPSYIKFFETNAFKRAYAHIGVSKYILKRSREIFNVKQVPGFTIYNGVNSVKFQRQIKRQNSVVFSGTLMRLKGVISLIEAWKLVNKEIPCAHLHIYGKDSLDNGVSVLEQLQLMLEDTIKDTVTFHGHVSQNIILQHLLNARMAVFPSYCESLGMAPLEAMAAGCPTIFTTKASGPEIIENRTDGLLVNPDDPEQIAKTIVYLFNNPETAQEIGYRGAKKIDDKFSIEKLILQNEKLYHSIISNN